MLFLLAPAALLAIFLTGCSDSPNDSEDSSSNGGQGGSSNTGGSTGTGGTGGQGGSGPSCLSAQPNSAFLVSSNRDGVAADGRAETPAVSDEGFFAFQTQANNFFPPETWINGSPPNMYPQVFAKKFDQVNPIWASFVDKNNPQLTLGQGAKVAGDLLVFEGDPNVYGFSDGNGTLYNAPIVYQLSTGLRTFVGADAVSNGETCSLTDLDLMKISDQDYRLTYLKQNFVSPDILGQISVSKLGSTGNVVNSQTVSSNSMGQVGNGFSEAPKMSPNGQFVTFWSTAKNLDLQNPPPPDQDPQIPDNHMYVTDVQTGTTHRIVPPQGPNMQEDSFNDLLVDNDGNVAFRLGNTTNGYTPFLYRFSSGVVENLPLANPHQSTHLEPFLRGFSADGKYLIYEHREAGNPDELVLRNMESGVSYALHDGPTLNSNLSPNGRWVTWQEEQGTNGAKSQIYGLEICDETQLTPFR